MKTKKISLKAHAKINLTLKVLGQRVDGYHLLDSLMHLISIYDDLSLEIIYEEGNSIPLDYINSQITLTAIDEREEDDAVATLPPSRDNLITKAVLRYLQELSKAGYELPNIQAIDISLRKRIPIAAGLGGGSADAAVAILGINHLCGGVFRLDKLLEIGLAIGADLPFLIASNAYANEVIRKGLGGGGVISPRLRIGGIGEVLSPIDWENIENYSKIYQVASHSTHLLLVKPAVSLSTADIFSSFDELHTEDDSLNDLQKVAISKESIIGQCLECLNDLLIDYSRIVSMSGSGPTVFALTDEMISEDVLGKISQNLANITIYKTSLYL